MAATIIISALLLCAVALIVRKLVRDKRRGASCASCGGGCAHCPGAGLCHPEHKK